MDVVVRHIWARDRGSRFCGQRRACRRATGLRARVLSWRARVYFREQGVRVRNDFLTIPHKPMEVDPRGVKDGAAKEDPLFCPILR